MVDDIEEGGGYTVINLSNYSDVNYRIFWSTKKFGNTAADKHIFVPVVPNKEYKVETIGNSGPTDYAWVTGTTQGSGDTPDYCVGYTLQQLSANTKQVITAPSDAAYIYFTTLQDSTSRRPSFFGKINTLDERFTNLENHVTQVETDVNALVYTEEIDMGLCDFGQGFPNGTNWLVDNKTRIHFLIPYTDDMLRIQVTPRSGAQTCFGFLTQYSTPTNGATVYWDVRYLYNTTFKDVEIPTNTEYIVFVGESNTSNFKPQSISIIKKLPSVVDSHIENSDALNTIWKEIDLSALSVNSGWAYSVYQGRQKYWRVDNYTRQHNIIKVEEGYTDLYIKAKDNHQAMIFFLSQYTTPVNNATAYMITSQYYIGAGSEKFIKIPSNARYIYVTRTQGNDDWGPAEVKIGMTIKSHIENESIVDDKDYQEISTTYVRDNELNTSYWITRINRTKTDGSKQYPFVLYPNPTLTYNDAAYSALQLASLYSYRLICNASFFDNSTLPGKLDGFCIQNGINMGTGSSYHTSGAYLTIDSNGVLGSAPKTSDPDTLIENGIVSACLVSRVLVDNFINQGITDTTLAQRQVFGQYANGDYALLTFEGRGFDNSTGITIADASAICVKLGLKFAVNLDGGGSTETVIGKRQLNMIYEAPNGRKVVTFLVFNGTDAFNNN